MDEYRAAACELAEQLLSRELPRRWSHVAAVAKRADEVAPVLNVDADLLVSAAWLHDIGYAPQVVDTGFHPLDGARFLRGRGFPDRLASLVAHHSCAMVEAELRGLAVELQREFPREPVFPDARGGYRDRNNIEKDFRKARAGTPFEWVVPHTYRKTVATLLDAGGFSARVIADQLGHSRISMTQDVYMGRRAVDEAVATALEGLVTPDDDGPGTGLRAVG